MALYHPQIFEVPKSFTITLLLVDWHCDDKSSFHLAASLAHDPLH